MGGGTPSVTFGGVRSALPVLLLVVACAPPEPPRTSPPTPKEAPGSPEPRGSPDPEPPPRDTCPAVPEEDLRTLAEAESFRVRVTDLDGDPSTEEVLVAHSCRSPLRCDWNVYARRDGCLRSLGQARDLMGAPGCERGAAKGTPCTLSGMRLMIHGDAQEMLFPFSGAYQHETFGTRHAERPRRPK